jgi:RNA polymerase-binding transcription factor DksA
MQRREQRVVEQLRGRRALLLRRFNEHRARAAAHTKEIGDPADQARDELERGIDQVLMELEQRELERLLDAEQKLHDEDPNTCRRCGREIDPRRLAARPESLLCVDCAGEAERQGVH